MLPRENRLTDRRLFDHIRDRGLRRSGDSLLIRALRRGSGPAKVAVIMSKKAAKLAVDRNRHRRVVRDELRTCLSRLEPGWNITVTIRRSVTGKAGGQKLREEVRTLFAHPFSG